MKEKMNLQPLVLLTLLLYAGTASPSNSLDDKISKTPFELIIVMLMVILASLAAYSISNFLEKQVEAKQLKQLK